MTTGDIYAAMGPNPEKGLGGMNGHNNTPYRPWLTEIPTLRCPSDPGTGLPAQGRTNYAACLGDSSHRSHQGPSNNAGVVNSGRSQDTRAAQRGMFVPRDVKKFRDVLDGLSNTIAAGEIVTDLGDRDTRSHVAGRRPDLGCRRCSSLSAVSRPATSTVLGCGG